MIMAVEFHDGEAECGRLLIKRVQVVRLPNCCSLLEAVAIDDHCEPVELVLGGGHQGLPVAALLKLAVAEQNVCTAAGDVQLGRQRMADGDWQPVPEGSGIGLDSPDLVAVGVPVERRQRLQEGRQVLRRQETEGGQGGVEGACYMALGEDEPVPVGIVDRLWGHVEYGTVEGGQDVNGREVAADVAGIGVMDQLQVLDADLARRLGDMSDLLVAMRMGMKPREDRHRDVLGSKGGHAGTSCLSVVSAMQLRRTDWTSRCAASASWDACAARNACTSRLSRARWSPFKNTIAALAAAT